MFENAINTNISFIIVFIEGLLSFFSPCVIPLIPVYMSYLAGDVAHLEQEGKNYNRKRVLYHTMFFVVGISFAFFLLGMSFSMLGRFFNSNRLLFTRIGGIIIVVLGLFQLGVFDFKLLQRERKIHLDLSKKAVNPFLALLMGFTFSFAWTPCIGPALSSVLIMASGAKTSNLGYLLVFIYTLGFIIPFILLGLFTRRVLIFLQEKKKFLKYTVKGSAILLIIIGIMTFTGWMNGITSYLNLFSNNSNKQSDTTEYTEQITDEPNEVDNQDTTKEAADQSNEGNKDTTSSDSKDVQENKESTNDEKELIPAIDFTLTDQYGNVHTLSDYKGKVVFLNFWASWCGPCKREMPHIEELYEEYNLNEDDVVFLGVANPKSSEYPRNIDEEKEDIIKFLEDNEFTFPTVFDETGEVYESYYVYSYPTTFMINKDGNVLGYVSGMMTKDIMESVIQQTLESTEQE